MTDFTVYVQFTFKRINENIRKMVTEVKESVAGKAQVRNISQSLGRLAKVSHTHMGWGVWYLQISSILNKV